VIAKVLPGVGKEDRSLSATMKKIVKILLEKKPAKSSVKESTIRRRLSDKRGKFYCISTKTNNEVRR